MSNYNWLIGRSVQALTSSLKFWYSLDAKITTNFVVFPIYHERNRTLLASLQFPSVQFNMLSVSGFLWQYIGQFQVTVFSRFCYVLLCNHEYIHCLNHRQAKDYITRRNETERKLKFERRVCYAMSQSQFSKSLLKFTDEVSFLKHFLVDYS